MIRTALKTRNITIRSCLEQNKPANSCTHPVPFFLQINNNVIFAAMGYKRMKQHQEKLDCNFSRRKYKKDMIVVSNIV